MVRTFRYTWEPLPAQTPTSAKLRRVVGSRAGRWEVGPSEKNKCKVKRCSREQSWEVGGGAQRKEQVQS